MTEPEARDVVLKLTEDDPDLKPFRGTRISRHFQTARQIGSSWPTRHINLIHIDYDNDHDFWRVVIE